MPGWHLGDHRMQASDSREAVGVIADPYRTDPDYEFVLTDILRRRRRPLLMLIDEEGELLYSSLPDHAPAAAHRLLGQALAEAKTLFQTEMQIPELDGIHSSNRGQQSALVMLDNEFYSLRLFSLHRAAGDVVEGQYAALVEPVVGPLSDAIDFQKLKQTYRLSNREVDVLEALMSGKKDKEIATGIGVTAGTVRAYLKSIRAKLRVTTRTAVVNLVHEFSADNSSNGRAGN